MSIPSAIFPLPAASALQALLASKLPAYGMVRWADATGSTNADLMALARDPAAPALPWLLGTHEQIQGRGRAGRPWRTAAGAALMLSCAFETRATTERLPSLSIVAGIAACEALRRHAGDKAAQLLMKWPNDLQLGAAKLAGILVETTRQPVSGKRIVVIGMGMNLRDAPAISQALGREVADWQQVSGSEIPDAPAHLALASRLAHDLAQAWESAVQEHEINGCGAFIDRHARVDALAGHEVNVIDNGTVLLSGAACGVDALGHLLVRQESGLKPIAVGEISVRTRA